MNETVRVAVGLDRETEQPFVFPCEPGDYDDTADVFDVEVPHPLWAAVDEAWETLNDAIEDVHSSAGFDTEQACMVTPCEGWVGEVHEGREWWVVVLSASGDDQTWPIRDATLTHRDTRVEANDVIRSLPERFHLYQGMQLVEVDRERLSVKRSGFRDYETRCFRCGWSRDEHREADDG